MNAQLMGLPCWAFVVPIPARRWADPTSSNCTKEAVAAVFQAVHQYGGVVLGEPIGQSFTILWMLLVSFAMCRSRLFKPWLAWFGTLASAVYALAQTELLATVIPAFPIVPQAGFIAGLPWSAWMIARGIFLLRTRTHVA